MDIISRYHGGARRKFSVYPQEEADSLGIQYAVWREARPGQWGLSDDGYVGECLKVYDPKGGKAPKQVVLSFGCQWTSPSNKLTYLDRVANRAWSENSGKHWTEREVRRTRSKKAILAYVMMFFSGGGIDWPQLGIIYRKDWENNDPGGRIQHYFKQPAFKKAIENKMIEVLSGRGKSREDILSMFDKAFEIAEKNKDPKAMRLVARDLAEIAKMFPAKSGFKQIPVHPGDAALEGEFIQIEGAVESAQKELPPHTSAPAPVAPPPPSG